MAPTITGIGDINTLLYTTQFTANMEMLLQQTASVLRSLVMTGSHVGKMASPVNQIAPFAYSAPSGRYNTLNKTDIQFDRRWVFPQPKEFMTLLDDFDLLQTIVDPKGPIAQSAVAAANRAFDDAIIAAALGTAQVGEDAASLTAETFDTTDYQVVDTFGASAACGLTVAKLNETRRMLLHNHAFDVNEADKLVFVVGSQQQSDLYNLATVVSSDFSAAYAPEFDDKKRVTRFMGFDIVTSERLNTASSGTIRKCFAFVSSGLYLGMWLDHSVNITQRYDLSSQPVQFYSKLMFGATRLMQGKVIEVDCLDSTGADNI